MATFPGGSFFQGLSRPWLGLHTIDTVRRDAAGQGIWFETYGDADSDTAQVMLQKQCMGHSMTDFVKLDTSLIYTIDMQNDVIDKIQFRGEREGELRFSYLQEVSATESEIPVNPRRSRVPTSSREFPGMLWLVRLSEGTLTP